MIQSRVGGWQGTKEEGVRLRVDEADVFFDPMEANVFRVAAEKGAERDL